MTADILALLTLSLTLLVHLVATVWWAASLTRRVDHIEKWIIGNAHTAERLATLEQQLKGLAQGISRIEHHLRHKT